MTKKRSAVSLIIELKRKKERKKERKHYISEDKIRIVIERIEGEVSIAELYLYEGISQANYYK